MDFIPTREQVDRGLKDIVLNIRRAWVERLKVSLDSMLEDEEHAGLTL
jgi:hypothetical protein